MEALLYSLFHARTTRAPLSHPLLQHSPLGSPPGPTRPPPASPDQQAVADWETEGRPVPPPDLVKRTTLADFAAAFRLDTLIETGTFLGGTIHALKDRFPRPLHHRAQPRARRPRPPPLPQSPHIHILNGDSGQLLASLLQTITVPCLFWLDGHYSGGVTAQAALDTPILAELQTILDHPVKTHVILIDDARLFNGTADYPTLDQYVPSLPSIAPTTS